jgi:hypothetical protein
MRIIVKELPENNHVYLFDATMRPLVIDIVSKRKTKGTIKNIMKTHNITDLHFVSEIDFGTQVDSFRNHI